MLGSPILDVAIGMAFIYLLLSLIASAIQEIIASFLQARAANLQRGLRSLFSNDKFNSATPLLDLIYKHGLVRGLYQDPDTDYYDPYTDWSKKSIMDRFLHAVDEFFHGIWIGLAWVKGVLRFVFGMAPPGIRFTANAILLPAYIPSRTFALALMDILNDPKPHGWDSLKNIEDNLSQIRGQFEKNKVVEALLALVKDAAGKPDKLQANLENWYNDSMDRVSGWYKRYVQRILILIGFALAVAFNVDSIRVAQVLWTDKVSRDAIAAAAGDYLKSHQDPPVPAPGSNRSQMPGSTANPSSTLANSAPAPSGTAIAEHANANKKTGVTPPQAPKGGTPSEKAPSGGVGQDSNDPHSDESKRLNPQDLQDRLKATVNAFDQVNNEGLLPIGWRTSPQASFCSFWYKTPRDWTKLLRLLAGWLITAIALSLGAPFWFDTLNKFMVVRGTVKPQEKSQTEKSKDA